MVESQTDFSSSSRNPTNTEESELPRIRELLTQGDVNQSLARIEKWLTETPLCHQGFALLGEIHEARAHMDLAIVAYQRALYLREYNASRKPSDALSRLTDLEANALGKPRGLKLDNHIFPRLQVSKQEDGIILVARSKDGSAFCKIEVAPNSRATNTLAEEANILFQLTEKECLTSPQLLNRGLLSIDDLRESLSDEDRSLLEHASSSQLPYFIQEFLRSDPGYGLADVTLALLEQKSLGVFHGDVRPARIRFDARKKVCKFINFDLAKPIPPEIRDLGNHAFFEWCSEQVHATGKDEDSAAFLAHFPNVNLTRDFWPLFRNEALQLDRTRLFRTPIPASGKGAILQTFGSTEVVFPEAPDADKRVPLWEPIEIARGETFLDIGGTFPSLSIHFAQRGGVVTSLNPASSHPPQNAMLAHLLRLPIRHLELDLATEEIPREFETVFLGSFIQQRDDLTELARKIAAACKHRLLIECNRPAHSDTGLPELIAEMEQAFPGFEFSRSIDGTDTNTLTATCLLELRRKRI